ncbi:MAG: glutaredoxin family protein [Acidobacteria bacterium]|nr:glutaredoxin family protein [Acidobacteriota bacterium]
MHKLVLYSRPGCHLCEEARATLERARREIPFDFQEVNIEKSAELQAEFGEQIPVLFVDGRKKFKYRIDPKKLRRVLLRGRPQALSKDTP